MFGEEEVFEWLKRRGPRGQKAKHIILIICVTWSAICGLAILLTAIHMIAEEANSFIYYLEHKELSNKDLREQAIELANQIFSFSGERILNNPIYNNIGEENQSRWNENTKKMINYSQETTNIYNTRYLNEVVRIKQEFLKRNLTDQQLDQFYDKPTNPIGMQIVAERFLELANRLP